MFQNLAPKQNLSGLINGRRSSSSFNSIASNLSKLHSQSMTPSLISSLDSQSSYLSNAVPVSLRQFQTNRNSRVSFKANMLPERKNFSNFNSKHSVSFSNLNESILNKNQNFKLDNIKPIQQSSQNTSNVSLMRYQSLNDLEQSILNSQNPIEINETEEIMVNNIRGIWANRTENMNWRGALPLNQYRIKQDPNPELVMKKPQEKLKYTQEINVRYLNPPKLEKPGDIVIQHDPPRQIPPAPPLIIRQTRPRLPTPPPLIIREEPPKTPEPIPSKVITIPGRLIPPPPRKLVIENLPELPAKPQSILIERWLPYSDLKRRVIYQRPSQPEHCFPEPKNLIVNWEKPDVEVVQELKYLGVEEVNPKEYRKKYSNDLKPSENLPEFVHRINPPQGITLAIQKPKPKVELEGDLEALQLLDLDKVGLSEYREYLNKTKVPAKITNDSLKHLLNDLFTNVDIDKDGFITSLDAQRIVLHLNNRFGVFYNEKDVVEFFSRIKTEYENYFSFDEFSKAFDNFYSL